MHVHVYKNEENLHTSNLDFIAEFFYLLQAISADIDEGKGLLL